MEPLFETKTTLTLEEYVRAVKYYRRKMRRFYIVWSIFMLITALLSLLDGVSAMPLFALTLVVIIFVLEYIQTYVQPKKFYESSPLAKNNVLEFKFYEEKMEQITENDDVVIPYADIYKLYETKTNFYIMKSVRQVFIIVKENCSDELCQFIRSKKQVKK